ncbi:MAG: hypothetical protein ABR991_12925 [Terracidiphilus sp.]|jgi:hypothetical protein
MRLLAFIPSGGESSTVMHFTELPSALTVDKDTRQKMGRACFLVIEETPEGVFLYRYGAQGKFAGDTWHLNIDDVKDQAKYEYAASFATWSEVPVEVQDVIAYGVNHLGLTREAL